MLNNVEKITLGFIEEHFNNKRDFFILTQRVRDKKLSEIGDALNITRERVRQLENRGKSVVANLIEDKLWDQIEPAIKNNILSISEVKKFIEEDAWELILYSYKTTKGGKNSLKYSEDLQTLVFNTNPETISEVVQKTMKDGVEGLKKEAIRKLQENLLKENIRVTVEEAETILKNNGLDTYDEFMLRKNINIGESIKNEVKYNYPSGINVSNKKEVDRFREVIEKKYKKDLTSCGVISRIQYNLLLVDKATYTHPVHLTMDECLEEDIIEYIKNMSIDRISYKKLFDTFEDRLLKESAIKNYHALHGYLNKIADEGEDIICVKAYVCKPEIKNIKSKFYFQKIADHLLLYPKGLTKDEIVEEFEDFDESFLRYIGLYFPEVINIHKNIYLNLKSLRLSSKEINDFKKVIDHLLDNKLGYTDRYLLCDYLKIVNYDLWKKLQPIDDSEGIVFYMAKYLFSNDYFFSTPHIVKNNDNEIKTFTLDDLNERLRKLGDMDYFNNLKNGLLQQEGFDE